MDFLNDIASLIGQGATTRRRRVTGRGRRGRRSTAAPKLVLVQAPRPRTRAKRRPTTRRRRY